MSLLPGPLMDRLLILILFKDTEKNANKCLNFVKKCTMLRYSLFITEWIVSSVANQRTGLVIEN